MKIAQRDGLLAAAATSLATSAVSPERETISDGVCSVVSA
jgi:hypothetical protein